MPVPVPVPEKSKKGLSASMGYSVPCARCGEPVRFGDEACDNCHATVTRELKDALAARLEASSSEYGSMQNRISEAVVLLVVGAALQLILGGFTYLALPESPNDEVRAVATFGLVVSVMIAVGMITGALVARRHPKRGIVIGLLVWVVPQVILLAINPLGLLGGVLTKLVKLAALLVLVRGVFAAREAEALRRELIAS